MFPFDMASRYRIHLKKSKLLAELEILKEWMTRLYIPKCLLSNVVQKFCRITYNYTSETLKVSH